MRKPAMNDITRLLCEAGRGDAIATDSLLPLVYEELRSLAHRYLSMESPGHTLQATALVHEAYLRLVGDQDAGWQNRAHFFGAAAKAIRRILVDHSRRRGRLKRGGAHQRVMIDESALVENEPSLDILALDEALERLSEIDAQKARVVELRFFGGLSVDETSTVIGVSSRTIARDWRLARAWLRREIGQGECADE